VLTASDESRYQDVSETHSAQHISQQKLEARRLGECPGLGAGVPMTPHPEEAEARRRACRDWRSGASRE